MTQVGFENEGAYENRRSEIATYFDQTAAEAWKKLTSNESVSRIRATVRAGRAQMLTTLSSWLPEDLTGRRILDAGCGTGMLAAELAARGADVVAIDLSPTLVQLAKERYEATVQPAANPTLTGSIDFISGDMLDASLGRFDHVVAMDSLIHYESGDIVNALARLCEQTEHSVLFTVAPRTPLLSLMHKSGKLFPKKDRSPAIVPVAIKKLHEEFKQDDVLLHWLVARQNRVDTLFYKSHALELLPT
jgi:magnesium-protoporphyrin O-methyltransferase